MVGYRLGVSPETTVALAVTGMEDDSDASLARQGDAEGDGAPSRAATDIDSATVVIDPALPAELRMALAARTGKLVPYQGPVPAPEGPASSVGCFAFLAGLFFTLAALAVAHGGGGDYTLFAIGALSAMLALLARPRARDVAAAHSPVTEHRRYVLPSTDIDTEHWQLWKRAVDARNRIVRAEVVGGGQIDSVQVTEVLPQRLWDIADRLARLAEVRARHQDILGKVPADDPDIAPAVARQRRAQAVAVADVARRVRDLESFADLVDAADLAMRKEMIMRELSALDDTHADLLAGVGDSVADTDLSQRLTDDVGAVIEQAREAVRQANDAALHLALPGEDPDDSDAR
jgi:hypothetical protein